MTHPNNHDLDEEYERARNLYAKRNFDSSKIIFDKVIPKMSDSLNKGDAIFLRAAAYESGDYSDGIQLDKALDDYRALMEMGGDYSYIECGKLGAARVLYKMHGCAEFDQIKSLCIDASMSGIRKHRAKAMVLLGFVYQVCRDDCVTARKWYMKAFLQGSQWGLRHFAISHMRDGNIIRGALSHAAATVFGPFMYMIFRIRTPI